MVIKSFSGLRIWRLENRIVKNSKLGNIQKYFPKGFVESKN
jgi:hypothetical protein